MKLSSYKPYTNKQWVTTAGCIPFDSDLETEIMAIIDGTHAAIIEQLRKIVDKTERHNFKAANLPCFTPSVIVKDWRNTKNIVSHSGLICIDIDSADNPKLNAPKLRDEIFLMPECAAVFVSASGNGVAAIFHIIPGHHVPCFETLQEFFKSIDIVVDSKCVDQVRLRFTSYDPLAKYRPDPEILMPDLKFMNKAYNEQVHYNPDANVGSYVNFLKAVRFANNQYEFKIGSRHWHLMHVASYCNHIGMPLAICEKHTLKHYINDKLGIAQIGDLTETALLEPIKNTYRSYKDQFATMKHLPKPYTFKQLRWLLDKVDKNLLRENLYKFGRESFIGCGAIFTVTTKFNAFFMHIVAPDISWTLKNGYTVFTNEDIRNNVPENAYLEKSAGVLVWCCKKNKIPLSWL